MGPVEQEERERKERKRYLVIKWGHLISKLIGTAMFMAFVICCVPLLKEMAEYIRGDRIMETALTNSQMTAMIVVLMICFAMYQLLKMVKRL